MHFKIITHFLILFILVSFENIENQRSFAAAVNAPRIERLAWLAGTWYGEDSGIAVEEVWLEAKGGLMLGMNRTLKKERAPFFEYLRIVEEDTAIYYYASPGGRPATPFRLVNLEKSKVVFENPEHDFPQRIIYRLEDQDSLISRVEGVINSELQFQEWHLKRLKKTY
jgi:hypothetical protein